MSSAEDDGEQYNRRVFPTPCVGYDSDGGKGRTEFLWETKEKNNIIDPKYRAIQL